jgi:hypothetical protein
MRRIGGLEESQMLCTLVLRQQPSEPDQHVFVATAGAAKPVLAFGPTDPARRVEQRVDLTPAFGSHV